MRTTALVGFAVVAIAVSPPASSANILTTGNFDSNTTGWTAAGGATLAWSNQDAFGKANSGSAVVTAIGLSGLRSGSGAFQCAPIRAGALHALRALAQAPKSQQREAFPGFRVAYYDSAACNGPSLGMDLAIWPDVAMGTWWNVHKVLRPPAGTTHAWVGIMTWADVATPTFSGSEATVLWDDVSLVELPRRLTVVGLASD